ncbi:hypothetical protein SAMN04489730_6783 [Amycolatopsis australiensis]|uniref:Uncharacterized protein n=1 Tax=Amycolatopsis australiensis TaxID=546364 RepID=A0A1K1SU22_9PSEU|nr:hypothetical protein SAMN04489730_6783 [Amycolatopsis australiensis]
MMLVRCVTAHHTGGVGTRVADRPRPGQKAAAPFGVPRPVGPS